MNECEARVAAWLDWLNQELAAACCRPMCRPASEELGCLDALPPGRRSLAAQPFATDAFHVGDEFNGRIKHPAASGAECR